MVGGNTVQGTVTLSAAPATATSVALSSSGPAATVPSSVTVAAGATTATFTVTTTVVTSSTSITISATFDGTTRSTVPVLTITPVPLAANFTVTSLSAAQRRTNADPNPVVLLPAGTADACPLINSSNPVLDCRFDGATSTGPVTAYVWTYAFGTQTRTETTTTPQLRPTASGCGFFAGQTGAAAGGVQFIGMSVQLQVRDGSGNLSAVRTNQNVRIFPAGLCGYGF